MAIIQVHKQAHVDIGFQTPAPSPSWVANRGPSISWGGSAGSALDNGGLIRCRKLSVSEVGWDASVSELA